MSNKVLILVPDLRHPGGVANYYRCLQLDKEENISYFYVNAYVRNGTKHASKALLILKKIFFIPTVYLKFLRIVWNYDLIHVNPSLNSNAFFRDMIFIAISSLAKKKVLIFIRGWDDHFENKIKYNWWLKKLFLITYGKARRYIVLGKVFKSKLLGLGISPENNIVVETTVADSRYLDGFILDDKINTFLNEVKFLFISRIVKNKGVYIAIDAINECRKRLKRKITLYIAGDGDDLSNAKRYVARNRYDNIHFLGNIEGEAKGVLLKECHIMLFPTCYGEGLPNSIMEGMLYGMPIISREIGGIPDVVRNGENGFISDSVDSHVFASFCQVLIENDELYRQIAHNNVEKSRSLFKTEAVKSRILSLYDEIIN